MSFKSVALSIILLIQISCVTSTYLFQDPLGYHRELYGEWIDEDKDCQNTRHEVLIKTSLIEPKFKTSKKCQVVSGKWYDPYSGEYFYKASDLDIDHIWPVKTAHISGASVWSKEKKQKFYNDIENLIPVSAGLNRSKKDRTPSEWLPPNKAFRCEYLQRWSHVQAKYKLKEPIRQPASVKIDELKENFCKTLKN